MFGFFKKILGLPTEAEQAKAAEVPYKVETPAPKADAVPVKKAEATASAKKPTVVAKTGGKGRKPKAK